MSSVATFHSRKENHFEADGPDGPEPGPAEVGDLLHCHPGAGVRDGRRCPGGQV